MTASKLQPETLAAQAMGMVEPESGGVALPIHVATTYLQREPAGNKRSRIYGRADNPTFDQPEALLAALEGGTGARLYASGMAAATAVFLALQPGDHVVAPTVMYYGLRKWLSGFARHWGLDVTFAEMSNSEALPQAIRPGHTKLIWIESPANPLWHVTDIARMAAIAHAAGARLAVDSTSATPVHTRPLELGADLVMHSTTKYLAGHSDVIGGALVTRADDDMWQRLGELRTSLGSVPSPFDAWLLTRGMRTLFLRVRHASATALTLAETLSRHPRISSVLYPGLAHHPHHNLASSQMTGGFGGMLSIRLAGGAAAAARVASLVSVWKRATSLGSVESLIEHRRPVEGPDSVCPDDLLRLSVGIEDVGDLISDLEAALEAAA